MKRSVIGRDVIDPKNADVVYVAAVGHLYTYNEERGLYKPILGLYAYPQKQGKTLPL